MRYAQGRRKKMVEKSRIQSNIGDDVDFGVWLQMTCHPFGRKKNLTSSFFVPLFCFCFLRKREALNRNTLKQHRFFVCLNELCWKWEIRGGLVAKTKMCCNWVGDRMDIVDGPTLKTRAIWQVPRAAQVNIFPLSWNESLVLCLCRYVITARWDIIACTTHFHYELKKKKKVKHGKATDFQMCISGMPFELAFSIRVSTPSQLPDGMYMCEIPPPPLFFVSVCLLVFFFFF